MPSLEAGVYSGQVAHKRFAPKLHSFNYGLFMPLLDLDKLADLSRFNRFMGSQWWRPFRFKRSDYLGQGELKQAVLDQLNKLGAGLDLAGEEYRVMGLIQLRYFACYFSPLNLYYVYHQEQCLAVLAEVSNTPWNERHYYYIPAKQFWAGTSYKHAKAFHVSPFNHCQQDYVWKLDYKTQNLAMQLSVIEQDTGEKVFSAAMTLNHHDFSCLSRLALRPIFTLGLGGKMLLTIYWQALRLFIKRVPLQAHPKKLTQAAER